MTFVRIFSTLILLAEPAILEWMWAIRQTRRGTFFGVSALAGFADSEAARQIVRRFRTATRSWAVAAVALCWSQGATGPWLGIGFSVLLAGWWASFGIASRRTREAVGAPAAPPLRTAALFPDEPPSAWLDALDWFGMVAPIAVPVITALFLAAQPGHPKPPLSVLIALLMGLAPAGGQFALRYRARSSDWAPTPGASRKYRTLLGFMQSAIFTFLILQLCIMSLRNLNVTVYFAITFPGYALLYLVIFRIRKWLASNFSPESGDPMPDACWKWGNFYYNPDDPALVVPLRSGLLQSFNYARKSVWVVGALVTGVTVLVFVRLASGSLL